MATITTLLTAEHPVAEEILRKNGKENGSSPEPIQGLALAPLVDKIAYGIARGLVVAMKELEVHIANETRKVGDSVGRRLDSLQSSLQELTVASGEQRQFNGLVQETIESLKQADARQDAAIAAAAESAREADARRGEELAALRTSTGESIESLKQADVRQDAAIAATAESARKADARRGEELAALRTTTSEFSVEVSKRIEALGRDLSLQQEDVAALKSTLCNFSTTVEGLVQRLDRQADALRSMSAAYSQRETELESLVDGLARLRAFPAPAPVDRL